MAASWTLGGPLPINCSYNSRTSYTLLGMIPFFRLAPALMLIAAALSWLFSVWMLLGMALGFYSTEDFYPALTWGLIGAVVLFIRFRTARR